MTGGISAKTAASHRGMLQCLAKARALASDPAACATTVEEVSEWSVQLHLEHLLLAESGILRFLESVAYGAASDAAEGGPSTRGYIVLQSGFIPRGRGKAPGRTVPSGLPLEAIQTGFKDLEERYRALEQHLGLLDSHKGTLKHPLLGHFNPAQWLRFAHVHHKHHQKIIDDVLDRAIGGIPSESRA